MHLVFLRDQRGRLMALPSDQILDLCYQVLLLHWHLEQAHLHS